MGIVALPLELLAGTVGWRGCMVWRLGRVFALGRLDGISQNVQRGRAAVAAGDECHGRLAYVRVLLALPPAAFMVFLRNIRSPDSVTCTHRSLFPDEMLL